MKLGVKECWAESGKGSLQGLRGLWSCWGHVPGIHCLFIGRDFSETRGSPGPTLPVSLPFIAHRSGHLGSKETLGVGEDIEFASLSSWPGPQSV